MNWCHARGRGGSRALSLVFLALFDWPRLGWG